MTATVASVWIDIGPDDDGSNTVYVRACARLRFDGERGAVIGPVVRSAGLWGIDSESDGNYLASISMQELDELDEMLAALCLPPVDRQTVGKEEA